MAENSIEPTEAQKDAARDAVKVVLERHGYDIPVVADLCGIAAIRTVLATPQDAEHISDLRGGLEIVGRHLRRIGGAGDILALIDETQTCGPVLVRIAAAVVADRLRDSPSASAGALREMVAKDLGRDGAVFSGGMATYVQRRLTPPEPCVHCGGTGWVEDQNWEPDYPGIPVGRLPGNGQIRCGVCGGPDE